MNHALSFPPEDVIELPPLKSVMRSQAYYFQTRAIVRRFARSVDVLFIRVPFQIPTALLGLGTPKLLHVRGQYAQSDRGVERLPRADEAAGPAIRRPFERHACAAWSPSR